VRRRGRPPLPPGEAKHFPLTIRTTKAQKDELLRAAKAAGRSLAEEVDFRLSAVRARPAAQGEVDEVLDLLDWVETLVNQMQDKLEEVSGWVYSLTLARQRAAGGTKLMRDEAEEKFVTRPGVEPQPPKPKAKSRKS
jgi:hypothetical protein